MNIRLISRVVAVLALGVVTLILAVRAQPSRAGDYSVKQLSLIHI